jgi:hypothetical protein
MLQVIENCCSTSYLDMLKFAAMNSANWNLKYPIGMPFEDKHLKLDVIENEPVDEMLAGMAMGFLFRFMNQKHMMVLQVKICFIQRFRIAA